MFNFIKKAGTGVTSDKDDKERRKRDKKDRKEKQKRERASMSAEELLRIDEVRRSLKIRGRRKEKEKLPSGITADYTADFLASLERVDSPITTVPGSPSTFNHLHDGYTQSDSSETSLTSLSNPQNQKQLPPLPPKPPKRGILKTPKVSITNACQENGDHNSLARNTLQNELIAYQNLPKQNGVAVNGDKNLTSTLLVITSTSPSADSLTDTTNSSYATPPFSLSPVGESQGFHRWSRTTNYDDTNLPLPPISPLTLPKPRTLTILRQKPPRNDFGFSLRRAMVLERCDGNYGNSGGVNMRAVIFAEPGTIVQHNNETGLLPGDKLLEVNGVKVEDRTREDIIDLIKASGDSVTLKVQPVAELCELSRRSGHDGRDVFLDDSNIRSGTLRRSGSRRFNKSPTRDGGFFEFLRYTDGDVSYAVTYDEICVAYDFFVSDMSAYVRHVRVTYCGAITHFLLWYKLELYTDGDFGAFRMSLYYIDTSQIEKTSVPTSIVNTQSNLRQSLHVLCAYHCGDDLDDIERRLKQKMALRDTEKVEQDDDNCELYQLKEN